jgi:hypothetical protein
MPTLPFQCSSAPISVTGFQAATSKLGVDAATLWTLLSVETLGCGYLADRRPQILFERHIFHALTGGNWDATNPDVSNAQPGGYGSGGAAQYARLGQAVALNQCAALQSASWGLGQVMGENYSKTGFASVEDMVSAMCASEDGQLTAVVEFIVSSGLQNALQRQDWATYARAYNGPSYARNNYDSRLAKFYSDFEGGAALPDLTIRTAQLYLLFLGFNPQGINGKLGAHTLTALHNFQNTKALPLTAAIDTDVVASLAAALTPAVDLSLT